MEHKLFLLDQGTYAHPVSFFKIKAVSALIFAVGVGAGGDRSGQRTKSQPERL